MAQENEVIIIDSQKEPKEPNENKLNTSEEEEFVAIEEVNTTSTQSSDESSEQEEEEKKPLNIPRQYSEQEMRRINKRIRQTRQGSADDDDDTI